MDSDKWNARNDALLQLKVILSHANYRIQPNNMNELFKLVGLRLKDTHKGVQRGYIMMLGTLIDAIGPKVKQYHKLVLCNLIDVLADKQLTIRADALSIIFKLGETTGGDYIINALASSISKDSPELKIEALKWLVKEKKGYETCDHKLLVPGILICLQDKSTDIRKMAESLLSTVSTYIGKQTILKAIQDEKPTTKLQLTEAINKLYTPVQNKERIDSKSNLPSTIALDQIDGVKESTDFAANDESPEGNLLASSSKLIPVQKITNIICIGTPSCKKPKDKAACSSSKAIQGISNKISPTIKSVKRSKICLCEKDNIRNSSVSSSTLGKLNISEFMKGSAGTPVQKRIMSKVSSQQCNSELKNANKTSTSFSAINLTLSDAKLFKCSDSALMAFRPLVVATSKDKDKRVENDKKYPWPINEARPEYIESLKKSLKQTVNPNLYICMFNQINFKKYIDVVNAFISAIPNELDEIIGIFDLVLKWIALKFLDNNPTLNKVIIEFLVEIIAKLDGANYCFTDPEGTLLLMMLIDKLGSKISSIKDAARKLILSTIKMASIGKIAKLLVASLNTKSFREKIECISLLKDIAIQQNSLTFATDKDLNYIATLILTKDNAYKNAIISFLVEAFRIEQENCWNRIGKVDDAVMDEIKSKIKMEIPMREETKIENAEVESSSLHGEEIPIADPTPESIKQATVPSKSPRESKSAMKETKKSAKTKSPRSNKTSSQQLLNQLVLNQDTDDLLLLIRQAVGILNKDKKYSTMIIHSVASHVNISKVKNTQAMTNFLIELGIAHKNENAISYLQDLCRNADGCTMVCSVICAVPKLIIDSEVLIDKAMDILLNRLNEIDMEVVVEEIDRNMKENKAPKVYEVYHKTVILFTKNHGLELWESIKPSINQDLTSWVDESVYAKYPDFSNIIKSMKTKGVKGVAANLKEFSKSHKEFDFDKASSRCSNILMQQIKEEMGEKKPAPIKSSIEKIKEKLNSKAQQHHSTPSANVEARFKELSNEISKMKHKGVL
jgi:hypothetical protein